MIILAYILAIIGLLGSIVPGLAGPPFSWAALLVAGFSDKIEFTTPFLIVTAAVAVVITLLDYVVPSWSTKRHGGSKAGVWGCNIGLVISIIGLPFGPTGLIGVVFWPFVGALAGELLSGKKSREAMRAAWGAFVGFLTGTGLKLAYAIFAIVMLITRLV
ncbi:MAG: DUF456 domain-containing protein [Bacteroidales bacterium]|jgi:uncharacterized protein YqgC (DUF456 family)|nr:DUF456 domain-containing protein [Bacteroidales bacterium]